MCGCNISEARLIPVPPKDGSLVSDFLPLLILLTQLPACVNEYRQRNMPEDVIRDNLRHFKDGISIVKARTGTPGIDQTYFNWLVKFIKGTIFHRYGFNFEARELPKNIYVLQNRTNGSLVPVLKDTLIHQSGNILGNAGCTDTENSFITVFNESETEYTAHPSNNGLIEANLKVFNKDQYKLILKPGDHVLSVHIPRGANISRQQVIQSFKSGFNDAIKYYPDFSFIAIYCHSWLLDPNLEKLMNPNANIPQFGKLFTRCPAKSAGTEVFSFIFQRKMPLTDLPENTSLERAVKEHYINGKFVLAYTGIILPSHL